MDFYFSDFSKYRSQLMGISIILIMLFHAGILRSGFVGVEFFLVISAIGLYFSLSKNQDKPAFYKKRFTRVLPAYFLVAVPFFLCIQEFDIGDFLINLSGLCILRYEPYFWFVGLILLCYLIAPFYFKFLKHKYSIFCPFIVLVICFCLGLLFPSLELMLNRFAIFLLGFHLAEFVYNKKVIHVDSRLVVPICLIAFLVMMIVGGMPIYTGVKKIVFFFLTIPALVGFVIILKHCPSFILQLLAFMGGITLEIYLLHERVCLRLLMMKYGMTMSAVLSFPLCILLAVLLNKIIQWINKHLFSSK